VWLHEIKHDGFRVIARKDGDRVRLFTRNGRDLTHRFSLIVDAIAGLRSRSCIVDGEAVCGLVSPRHTEQSAMTAPAFVPHPAVLLPRNARRTGARWVQIPTNAYTRGSGARR
jgi:hypothetical protein